MVATTCVVKQLICEPVLYVFLIQRILRTTTLETTNLDQGSTDFVSVKDQVVKFASQQTKLRISCRYLHNKRENKFPQNFYGWYSICSNNNWVCACSLTQSCPIFATSCTIACHSLSRDFPGKNTGVGCHFPPPGESSQPRNWTHVFCIGRWILYHCPT